MTAHNGAAADGADYEPGSDHRLQSEVRSASTRASDDLAYGQSVDRRANQSHEPMTEAVADAAAEVDEKTAYCAGKRAYRDGQRDTSQRAVESVCFTHSLIAHHSEEAKSSETKTPASHLRTVARCSRTGSDYLYHFALASKQSPKDV